MRPLVAVALVSSSILFGLDVRKSVETYPMQAKVSDGQIGIDFMVQSFLAGGHALTIDDFLVVEVGVFPCGEMNVDSRRFKLRINGNEAVFTQSPGAVAASIKYPDWRRRPNLQAIAGMGDGGVVVGRPQPAARFPGDPRLDPRNRPVGRPPVQDTTTQVIKEPVDYTSLLHDAALPEGKRTKPAGGYLYFPYEGKLKSIKSLELLIDEVVLKLR